MTADEIRKVVNIKAFWRILLWTIINTRINAHFRLLLRKGHASS